MRLQKFFLILMVLFLVMPVARAERPPILTFTEGVVEMFSEPRQKTHESIPEGASRAKYEGLHYIAQNVTMGSALTLGAWLRTRPGGRARVIFENGDQLQVGPASFLRIAPVSASSAPSTSASPSKDSTLPSSSQASSPSSELELRHGMVRAIISKTGPRSRFRVRTASAVMGVRGTDFVVETRAFTTLTLIRGAVELREAPQKGSAMKSLKPQTIRTGETALVEEKKPVLAFSTSQLELKRVLHLTEPQSPITSPTDTEVITREKRAREVTAKDFSDHAQSPEEKGRLESLIAKTADADSLNRLALMTRIQAAPEASPGLQRLKEEVRKRHKLTEEQLKQLEKDPYSKYFEGTQTE
ncbi:MAG: FecR protein [Pseudomonadota bacterium]|jgi:hypothetical protein